MGKIITLILVSIIFNSCQDSNKLKEIDLVENIEVIKFMDMQTYSVPPNEETFWEFGDLEFAKIKLNHNPNHFYEEVSSFKKIENGLSESFDYAFLLKRNQSTDTIYASLVTNQWTIKKNGEFLYFFDEDGQLKEGLILYSTFFNDCW
ncbi:hypothetical protein [uncultured Winogradskyella sp.]|uniref:hypothetical protein n=1 Tax=uncultured Winogradskyella sp. TaxID=395353 RepID=UPI00263149C4|nr:hypothetical protein [uncultured Winogradskyella sp.]